MKPNRFANAVFGIVLTVACAPLAAQTTEPLADKTTIAIADVAANDVYVRSGDSLNHYTICKLQAGDTVTVVGERGEWIEILPPAGTFSLVSGDFVDTADNQSGTINGDNVRVRAGSLLNENKYTVQTLLPKGAPVTILGRNPDGFVRIQPPRGATFWVNRNYVKLRGAGESDAPEPAAARVDSAAADSTTEAKLATGVSPVATSTPVDIPRKSPTSTSSVASAAVRRQLEEIDLAAKAELDKPIHARRLDPVLARYRPIADQTEDDFAREYSKARMEQLGNVAALSAAIDKVNALDEKAKAYRYESLAARSLIPEPTRLTEPMGIEVQGVLKASALYPPDSATPRYRLIDPALGTDRTIGYVEIPADAGVNVQAYLGRYVGVRASAQRIQTGGVDPIPIYIARELLLMDPPQGSKLSQAAPSP